MPRNKSNTFIVECSAEVSAEKLKEDLNTNLGKYNREIFIMRNVDDRGIFVKNGVEYRVVREPKKSYYYISLKVKDKVKAMEPTTVNVYPEKPKIFTIIKDPIIAKPKKKNSSRNIDFNKIPKYFGTDPHYIIRPTQYFRVSVSHELPKNILAASVIEVDTLRDPTEIWYECIQKFRNLETKLRHIQADLEKTLIHFRAQLPWRVIPLWIKGRIDCCNLGTIESKFVNNIRLLHDIMSCNGKNVPFLQITTQPPPSMPVYNPRNYEFRESEEGVLVLSPAFK